MPSVWTFSIPAVKEVIEKYMGQDSSLWVDPFAGYYSPAGHTNDIEPDRNALSCMDALEYLRTLPSDTFKGVLFDPPYSPEQCLRRYTPKVKGTMGRTEYWAKCKDEIKRITVRDSHVISFAWDSCGTGKNRGFEIVEVKLLCHGAGHYDTIITVDRKVC